MNEILQRNFHMNSTDADLHGLCRPSALLAMLQEMATEHSVILGISRETMLERYNSVWLVARLWFRLDRPIFHDRDITITTWTRGATGAVSYRDYDLSVDGEPVGEAVASWMLTDIDNRTIQRMNKLPEVVQAAVPEQVKSVRLARPSMPKDLTEWMIRPVRYSDTDINGHMNNTRYIDVACDAVGFDRMHGHYLSEALISYSRECFAGSDLHILGQAEDPRYYIRGAADDGATHFDTILTFSQIPGMEIAPAG